MTDHYEDIAKTLVEGFKISINEDARSQITAAQFNDLAGAIQKALSVEKSKVVSLFEDVVKKLRAEIERPEIEL